MTWRLVILTVGLFTVRAAIAADVPPEEALKAYGTGYVDYPLVRPRMSAEGRLILESETDYNRIPPKRAAWASEACAAWLRALRASNAPADPSLVILTPSGGSIWECDDNRARLIEEWEDNRTPFTGIDSQVGNMFMSVAGQASFGPTNSFGFNFGQGVALYKRKLDLSATVGMSESNSNLTMNIAVALLYRFPITQGFSLNLGAAPQFLMSMIPEPAGTDIGPTITTSFAMSFQGGMSFYVPTGTVDLTGSVVTNGTYTMLVGHTFFFNVR
jgi:hypothetical protein